MLRDLEKRRTWCRRLLVFSVGLIIIASVIPQGSHASTATVASVGLDKILHCVAFAGVIFLAIGGRRNPTLLYGVYAILAVLAFGVAIEFAQYYIPYRSYNPVDILADAFGVLFGVLVWSAFLRFLVARRSEA